MSIIVHIEIAWIAAPLNVIPVYGRCMNKIGYLGMWNSPDRFTRTVWGPYRDPRPKLCVGRTTPPVVAWMLQRCCQDLLALSPAERKVRVSYSYYLRLAFFSRSKIRLAYNYALTIRENSPSHPHSIHCPHPVSKTVVITVVSRSNVFREICWNLLSVWNVISFI